MTNKEFQTWIQQRIVYLDGATGSNLMKCGMPAGVCPELWILDHPEVFISLQKAYVDAGSDILYAPTFGANRWKLEEYGLSDKVSEMNHRLVSLSQTAARGRAKIAGDITMTGRQLSPIGTSDFEDLVSVYREQAEALVDAGVELFVIETMMSLQETRAAVIAIKEVCDLPIFATLTFADDGRTLYGTDPVTAALTLEHLGVAAIGANCSAGPDVICKFIKQMAEVVSIPLIAKPNAGLPFVNDAGETCYHMDADIFAKEMVKIVHCGANIIGGCCGTTPEYIHKCKELLTNQLPIEKKQPFLKRVLTSERSSFVFDLNDRFYVIGERINPTGKKKLQVELREGIFDTVIQFAEEQEQNGASILDINMGMGGLNEKEAMRRALKEVMSVSNLPLCIDSSDCEVIEDALRRYPGRALVNSVSLEPGKAERLLPLIHKYGAMFILLPLSEGGLPKSAEEKKENIEKLVAKAATYGLNKEDIIVDGLVTTVSANSAAALETLETITYCKENGLATVCGLSNISFGLPERSNVNTAFLTAAMMQGLTMAICNPSQSQLMNAIFATDMLMNKQGADLKYIEKMTADGLEESTMPLQAAEAKTDIRFMLHNAVMKGNSAMAVAKARELLEQGANAETLLNEILLPAIQEVGELFNQGKYFLPQLIASANAMKDAISVLEPHMQNGQETDIKTTVVIATVKGDIHDIGKNLVSLMLKNNGMRVIDLGKDVPKEEIIQTAIAENADIIALSALMTTTMGEMQRIVHSVKEQQLPMKVIIGGAVTTQEYADEIGADGYSKDAAQAVEVVLKLMER